MSTCLSVSTVVGTEAAVAIVEKREEEGGSMEYGGGRRDLIIGGSCSMVGIALSPPHHNSQCSV